MAGDVKLKINGDASGLLAAVKTAMAQIEQEAKKLKLSPGMAGAVPGAPGSQTFQQTLQSTRAKEKERRDDQYALNIANNALAQKNRELDNLARKQKAAVSDKKAEAYYEEQINKALRERSSIKATAAQLEKSINGGMSGGGGFGRITAGSAATMLGVLGAGANYIGQRPIDIAQMRASAISMGTGRQLSEARTGEYTYQGMYGEDRQKATEQAASSKNWKTAGDALIAVGSIAALLAAIPTGGASLGLGGLALGGAGLAGLKSSFLDKGMADPAKYAAYQQQRQAQDFTTLLAASQESSPYRKDAIERFKATGSRDLGMQRTLGLNDASYYGQGGYLKSQMGLGFTDEMVTQSSQGILGAGGSSAMGRQSGIALQAQRGLGLTNANEVLGQLSGTQSIPEASKRSLIDIFARGFDSSKYAEENRKYVQAISEQAFKGGTTSEATIANIADLIRSTVTGAPTTRNIEAGKAAFDAYQGAVTSTSGYLGGINIASAMQDKDLRQLKDPAELQALLKLKPNEIDETDPNFIASAKQMGLTGPQLAEKLRSRGPQNMKNALGGRTGMAAIGMAETLVPGLDFRGAEGFVNLVNQEKSPERDAQIQKMIADAEGKMANKTTGRAGDTAVQASAKNAEISLDTLAASIQKFADDAVRAAQKLGAEAPAGRAHEAAVSDAYDAARKNPKPTWNSKTHSMDFPIDTASRLQNQGQ